MARLLVCTTLSLAAAAAPRHGSATLSQAAGARASARRDAESSSLKSNVFAAYGLARLEGECPALWVAAADAAPGAATRAALADALACAASLAVELEADSRPADANVQR